MSSKRSHSNEKFKSQKKFKKSNLVNDSSTYSTSANNEIDEIDILKIEPKTPEEAIDYLFSLFPSNKQINLPPIIYLHQIYYFTNLSRTDIDQYIYGLKLENKIKVFKFDSKSDHICICKKDSIVDYYKNLSKNNDKKEYSDLINQVIDKFYTKATEITIDKNDLFKNYKLNDSFITKLIQNGFLTIKDANTYWHSIPNIGIYMKLIQEARKILTFIISKKKFKEITLIELRQRNLKKLNQLGILYHCFDLIGSNIVDRIESPMGFVMRLSRDDG